MEKKWFAIRTKPSREEVAKINLENQGLSVYLPMMSRTVSHARRKKLVMRPVFPGYLFLRLAPEERNWHAISSTRGVYAPVRFGDLYVPVPDWVIAQIKQKENKETGAISLSELKREKLSPGMEVQVRLENKVSAEGVILSFNGQDNVILLMNLLGKELKAKVPMEKLEKKW